MNFLDYMYYRFAKAYHKWDGESGLTGIMAIALFLSLTLIDVIGVAYFSFFSDEFRIYNKELAKLTGVLIIGIIIFFTYRRYKHKYSLYDAKWGNEIRSTRIKKGVLIMLLFIIPIAFPFLFLNVLN